MFYFSTPCNCLPHASESNAASVNGSLGYNEIHSDVTGGTVALTMSLKINILLSEEYFQLKQLLKKHTHLLLV